jgi:hypothetical protein
MGLCKFLRSNTNSIGLLSGRVISNLFSGTIINVSTNISHNRHCFNLKYSRVYYLLSGKDVPAYLRLDDSCYGAALILYS